mmetsp:Transcript_26655/g.58742  ORF Transcript_26655/g.58742 Transcript_26655/m.58742 type:complete len:111 (-) Transcript_26655:557-889(-)
MIPSLIKTVALTGAMQMAGCPAEASEWVCPPDAMLQTHSATRLSATNIRAGAHIFSSQMSNRQHLPEDPANLGAHCWLPHLPLLHSELWQLLRPPLQHQLHDMSLELLRR